MNRHQRCTTLCGKPHFGPCLLNNQCPRWERRNTITTDQYARASKRKRAHARRANTIQTALQEMKL